MDSMESKMAEWRRRMPSKRALTSQLGHLVQQKSVAVLYTQSEQERIKNVTELINTATSEFEKGEHWDRILKVVDVLTNTSNKHVLKEAVRYVRLRLGDPSPRVVLLSLTLTEALMKNCNKYVHKEIGGEAFMAAMESLYNSHSRKRGRDSMEIEGRVLELIQTWGEAFMNQKFEFPYFIYTYEKLRKKGVKFPKYDKTKAPLFSSAVAGPRRAMDSVSSSSSASSAAKATVSSELAKLSSKEVFHVATNVAEMFDDMLHEAERESDSGTDRGVIVELAAQAQELVVRLQTVIQAAADSDQEDDLSKYLAVNDTLHVAISRYEDLKNGQHKKPSAKAVQVNGAKKAEKNDDLFAGWATSDNQQNHNDDDDDDGFGDFVRARVGGGDAAKPAAASSNNQTEEDDPFASFAAQRVTKTAAPEPAAKNLIDLWDDAPAQPQTVVSAPAAAAPASAAVDLWGDDLLLGPSPPAPVVVTAPVPAAKPQASPFDDIWGDLVSPAASAPTPTPAPAPFMPAAPVVASAPVVNNQTANPFDFFDDFSAKATIAAPVSNQTQSAAPAKANPFDFGFPLPSSQTQAPVPAAKPAAALNPFDF